MKQILILLIRLYRYCISPLLPRSCRFYPSCSEYCLESIQQRGCFSGLWQGIRRVLRCHPFSAGGYDPVILKKKRASADLTSRQFKR